MGLSLVVDGRPCKNPKCHNTINLSVPKRIRYCSPCQIHLKDLRALFPAATIDDLTFMMDNGHVSFTRAARMCGCRKATFLEYLKDRTIRSQKNGHIRRIEEGSLCLFQSRQTGIIPLTLAAKKLGIKRARLWYFYLRRYIRTIKSAIGLVCVRESDLEKIKLLDQKLRAIEGRRKAKAQYARPNDDEFSVTQAAKILGYKDPTALRNWIIAGKLKAEKRNRRWYIKKKDFCLFCRIIAERKIITQLLTRERAKQYISSVSR